MEDLDQEAVQPQSLSFAIIVSVCMSMTTILSMIKKERDQGRLNGWAKDAVT